VAADIRAMIMSGELPPGTQLPSTAALIQRYAAAGATIQRALGALKSEGYLRSHIGKGVYVRDEAVHVVDTAPYLAPSPDGYAYELVEVAEVAPPAEVAALFGQGSGGTPVLLRHRLLRYANEPVEICRSYYPAEIARGTELARRTRIRGGAGRVLADLGRPQREFVDRVSVRLPTTEELERLELPDDVPVIRQLRAVYSDNRRPVEVTVLIKGGHRYELRYRQDIAD
jgi:GntR family transcriptional regulator